MSKYCALPRPARYDGEAVVHAVMIMLLKRPSKTGFRSSSCWQKVPWDHFDMPGP